MVFRHTHSSRKGSGNNKKQQEYTEGMVRGVKACNTFRQIFNPDHGRRINLRAKITKMFLHALNAILHRVSVFDYFVPTFLKSYFYSK